jgi:hypothetical protein
MEIKMSRQALVGMFAITLVTVFMASELHAWGAYHVGYTHVGYGGIQHYGRTVAYGPGGVYAGGRAYGYGGYGGYHVGYGYGVPYGLYGAYAPAYYGAYHYGGFGYGRVYGGYRAGYYRRW